MKSKTPNLKVAGTLLLAALAVLFLVRHWQMKSDRAGCLIHMRNMYQTIYSVGGMKGVGAGQPYPGGPRELLKGLGEYTSLPRCPSGGTYSFGSDTSYSMMLNETIRCSHAEDLNHRWPENGSSD